MYGDVLGLTSGSATATKLVSGRIHERVMEGSDLDRKATKKQNKIINFTVQRHAPLHDSTEVVKFLDTHKDQGNIDAPQLHKSSQVGFGFMLTALGSVKLAKLTTHVRLALWG